MTEQIQSLIGKEFPCLDKGFVRLIDVMGDDAAIVQAARVSYGSGTKKVHEDRGLIRYLLRHAHTTPFEMVEFKFHVKLPIFVARQWIRHRTANVNEYSGRYSEMKDEFYVPAPDQVRAQSTSNKQGRSEDAFAPEESERIRTMMSDTQDKLYAEYQELLGTDLAREIARINLPVSNYTEWYWKIDLHNLFHFLRLRIDAHAQYEIRVYGEAMAEIVKAVVPAAWEAFEDYLLHARRFSRKELIALRAMLTTMTPEASTLEAAGLKGREAEEFLTKLDEMSSL
ncbi:MAG: FAD-dependent thymidylate synthase [Ignavibacteria bacterium]|nr:FAD-dependent thymidylate synthase [Ignavibacteria bacterium]MBP6509568.1 FAD-dependent thymidylate synthase [Candidatus Kapabacteria bacterium]MBK6419034.1 FAD-dependent thymidylate synthase [Ignavibacteria bacterium]MBK6760282.1 FAD-dependent thymidylate synthase [Ignavibacteria bacterium]MBK7033975.1 FAD-dependent thymidylate synthase [Ignavibacteria bacterium]